MSGDRLAGFPRRGLIYWAIFKGFCDLLVTIATVQRLISSLEPIMIEVSYSSFKGRRRNRANQCSKYEEIKEVPACQHLRVCHAERRKIV
jgi:hypothetical protein